MLCPRRGSVPCVPPSQTGGVTGSPVPPIAPLRRLPLHGAGELPQSRTGQACKGLGSRGSCLRAGRGCGSPRAALRTWPQPALRPGWGHTPGPWEQA